MKHGFLLRYFEGKHPEIMLYIFNSNNLFLKKVLWKIGNWKIYEIRSTAALKNVGKCPWRIDGSKHIKNENKKQQQKNQVSCAPGGTTNIT